MKIALITDQHFGGKSDSKSFNDYIEKFYTNQFFPYLKENNIDTVIDLGDTFDRRKYVNFAILDKVRQYYFDVMREHHIQLHSIVGNHSTYYRNTNSVNSSKLLYGHYDNVKVFWRYKQIEIDGFTIDKKVDISLTSDTELAISKSMGIGIIGFADALNALKPDLLFVLGDRYEILAAASAAMIARIPIAHSSGGETTEGAFDEAIRHSITKMAHLHFVEAEEYKQRVIQLGEHPDRVFQVGGLGVDNIYKMKLHEKEELFFLRSPGKKWVHPYPPRLSYQDPVQRITWWQSRRLQREEKVFLELHERTQPSHREQGG